MQLMENVMDICILITSVGGLVSPGIIDNLRSMPEICRIIGTDVLSEAIGFYMVDKGYIVPHGDAPDYIDVLSMIVEREAVNIIVPCSDEEVLTLSRHKDAFNERGVAILCSSYDVTSVAIDKGSMLTFLQERGLALPRFHLPTTITELFEAAKEFGYPSRPIVVKPSRGRGGRGVKILREDINVLETRDSQEMKLEWFAEALGQHVEGLVLMEYLSGQDYSVDVLADRGCLLYVVPRKRIKAILGPSQIGETVWNQAVVDMVEAVVSAFGFDSNVNIQLRCTAHDERPMVYEINPRVSGTIVAGNAAGVDLLGYGVRHALGWDVPSGITMRPVRMIRYLKEYFVDGPVRQLGSME
jgi:carbamoyl-phosphate synthase large subunit